MSKKTFALFTLFFLLLSVSVSGIVAQEEPLVAVSGAGNAATVRNFSPFSRTANFCNANCAYEPMMIINGITGEFVPWLATGYAFNDDATSLTFTLRDSVLWSDGEPFTASDVAFTFTMLRDKAGLQGPAVAAMGAQAGYVDSVTASDALTVVFTFKTPYSLALYDLAEQNIVPEHIWGSIEDPAAFTNENPVGTGPFTEVVNYTPEQYEMHRNPNYWQAENVHFGGFRVTQGLAPDANTLAIINGDYDWTGAFIPDIEQVYVSQDPENRGYFFPQSSTGVALQVVTERPPFDDVNVRKAISMAIDRELIVDIAMAGYTQPADVTGLSGFYASWKVDDVSALGDWTTYNVDEANRLLDEAGLVRGSDGVRVLPDGTPMVYNLNVIGAFANWVTAGDIIVQNLAAVGITVTINPVDFGGLFQSLMMGDFDLSLAYTGGVPYVFYRSSMSSTTYAPAGQPAFSGNYVRFVSEEADVLLTQWASTTDEAAQHEIAAQLQAIFAAEAPMLPLYYQPTWLIYKTTNFTGFPTADDPYAVGTTDSGNSNMLLVITHLQPQ